jgi:membrane-associated phospholipid phosphatase
VNARHWLRKAQRVDDAIYEAIAHTSIPTVDRTMSRLSTAANYSRIWIGAASILALTGGEKGRRAAADGLASIAVTATVVNAVLKPLARRRRPARAERAVSPPMPKSRSFPSGHAAAAYAFATGVGATQPQSAVPLRALALLVAYSRVHTGVHYPADAVIGSLLGRLLARITTWTRERRRP